MKKLKIDTLDKLEKFISDESVSNENRLKVFEEALKQYVFYIVLDEDESPANKSNRLIDEMKRIINEIKTTPQKSHYIGFMVIQNN